MIHKAGDVAKKIINDLIRKREVELMNLSKTEDVKDKQLFVESIKRMAEIGVSSMNLIHFTYTTGVLKYSHIKRLSK